jgi:O-antigen ligase/Tfp pilus assembly protein PilF
MLWVVMLMIVLAPLPEGSAYPWALTVIEIVIFALIAVWQLAFGCSYGPRTSFEPARRLVLPAVLFAALLLIQVTPLPSGLIRIVSPATYQLYKLTLLGWPREGSVDLIALHLLPTAGSGRSVLRPLSEVASGANIQPPVLRAKARKEAIALQRRPAIQVVRRWRTLSIAPSMSGRALLEMTAYGFLFLLILCYPFGRRGPQTEEHLSRAIVMAALLSGLMSAVIGVIEFFVWNGKILWLFVPYDWGSPQYAMPLRASGPFVNPDHFGNYLALVLPLAVGGALFPSDRFYRQGAIRVFCGVTAFLVMCAMLMSQSRASWMGAAIALAILFALSARISPAIRPRVLGLGNWSILQRACVLAFLTIALSFVFIGPEERNQIDLRLRQTVASDPSFAGRRELDGDTMAMVRDFPLVGVGLGCWPELFPHYRQAPWQPVMFREAHNDYGQVMAETGILGFILIAWSFLAIAQQLSHAVAAKSVPVPPLLVSLCASLAVMAFHEFSDFSLHTPANALLFTVLLGLALRIADSTSHDVLNKAPGAKMLFAAFCCAGFNVVLMGFALAQEKIPYPHNLRRPESVAASLALISAHPAEATPHLRLLSLAGDQLSSSERLSEMRTMVWLDPTNPYTKDLYAWSLLQKGLTVQALDEITQSVVASPMRSTHFYLGEEIIAGLSAPEKMAIEKGFNEAIGRQEDGAVEGLADYYNAESQYGAAAHVYVQGAKTVRDRGLCEDYLVGAGIEYARAGDATRAKTLFDQAIEHEPTDYRPYQYLVTLVLGPQHELKAAQNLITRGVVEGADVSLYDTLATVAQVDNDQELTETALQESVSARPCFSALVRLGMFYMSDENYERAALIMRRATELNPQSAYSYLNLAVAEDKAYRFADAERDFARAVKLEPANADYRKYYADFESKMARNIAAMPPLGE